MRRLLVWLVAVAVLSGCKGSRIAGPLDPFSRTRIEPARTGWIMGQPAADPYYPGSPQAAPPGAAGASQAAQPGPAAPASGSWTTPSQTPPAQGNRYAPPGGYNYRGASAEPVEEPRSPVATVPGDRITIPVAATSSAVAAAGSSPSSPDSATIQPVSNPLAGQERIVRTIGPPPRGSAGSRHQGTPPGLLPAAEGEPRRLAVPEGTIDIMDLPAPGPGSHTRPPTASTPTHIQLVSGTEEFGSRSAASPLVGYSDVQSREGPRVDLFSPRARYGHDPEYGWLKGRLEYSQIDRRWKLRYIPIDGTTDEFGGSVILSNTSLLSGYERGQFVEVHGSLGRSAQDKTPGYAPEFEVQEIK
ncbi:MAG: hypothetical protein ABIP48_03095, partial [Planctomycetota bacterium]